MDRTKVELSIDVEIMIIVIFLLGKTSMFSHLTILLKTIFVFFPSFRSPIVYNQTAGSGNRNNQSTHVRKRRNSDSDGDSKQRKCGLCKEIGHTRRNCPSLNV